MVSRRNLKGAHEESVLNDFMSHLKGRGISMQIIERPDPPDALVEIDGKRTWIEITDAFMDEYHARFLTTNVSEDKKRIPNERQFVVFPEEPFSSVVHRIIDSKCKKCSMQKVASAEGPGILLVGVFNPFERAATVAEEESEIVDRIISENQINVFDEIYIYEGIGKREFHVLHRRA